MFDPYGMLMAFRRTNRALGVRYHPAAVTGFDFAADGRTIEGVRLSDGGVVRCGLAVNAAGPRAAGVAATAGLALPVTAMKAESFVFRAEHGPADCPIVLDRVGGVQFKPEGAYFVGAAPGGGAAAGPDDFAGEPGRFEDEVWPRLAARVPGFERLRLERSWVGHIELNTLDFNPVIGLHPDRPNLYFLAGFSGHGAQHAPAGGRAIAELIVDGAYRTLDLSRFGYARVLSGEALREEA
jgi:glycine/D-amino acid oxidase-like deaminating enzyme